MPSSVSRNARRHNTAPAAKPAVKAWAGPLPAPDDLGKFDAILKGGAERIFHMAEAEQAHRMQRESDALKANIATQKAEVAAGRYGLFLGALISALSIIGAVAAAWMSAPWQVSVALVSVPIMSVVRTIILRK